MFFNLNAIKDYRKSQKQMAEILNEATMTNTPMSEREKVLLGAVRAFIANTKAFYGDQVEIPRLESAIKPYDPKPEREYTMPEWTKFMVTKGVGSVGNANGDQFALFNNHMIRPDVYNAIREALSKPKAPTE